MASTVWDFLPSSYTESYGGVLTDGTVLEFRWRADLGPHTALDEVAEYLSAFHQLLDLADRWTYVAAQDAATKSFATHLLYQGVDGITENLLRNYANVEQYQLPLAQAQQQIQSQLNYVGAIDDIQLPPIVDKLAFPSIPELAGPAPTIRYISYENPVDIVVGGVILFGIWGTIQVINLARSWKSRRRLEAAAADIVEAEARKARATTRLVEHFEQQVISGQIQFTPDQLIKIMEPRDLEALSKIAAPAITIEMPDKLAGLLTSGASGS